MNNGEFQKRAEQVEQLVGRVSELSDENARSLALELLRALMDMHGAGIARVVELLAESGESGRSSLAKLGSDPLVCGLLVLYGVHPVPVEERVLCALDKVRPKIKHSATVEFLGINDDVVRINLTRSGHGSADGLIKIIELAVREAAPEIVEVVAEGVVPSAFVPISMIQAAKEENQYEKSAA
jgi:hypothetical protein